MGMLSRFDQMYASAKSNRWFRYFTVFNRIALAVGFIFAGIVKLMGERFTSLSVNHPMGHYLEALHDTGYYYTFIGVVQVTAAILLLIPRTATIGAVLYFPVILNICILSLAVRFEGSLVSSPLMVLSNLYLLCWDYDKLKYIFQPSPVAFPHTIPDRKAANKFPTAFFAGAFSTVVLLVFIITNAYDIMPRNTLSDCRTQIKESANPEAGCGFCDCIHKKGQSLDKCLEQYNKALEKK